MSCNLVILGMHRSGTSMLARLLEQVGFAVGSKEELLAAQADNPLGFWERRDVVALNNDILSRQGTAWYGPRVTEDAGIGFQKQIEELVAGFERPWLLKDPRMVLTWPEWERTMDDAAVIFLHRHPLAVGRSLQRRNGFPLSYGVSLWEYYNRYVLSRLAGRQYLCLGYEQLLADPSTVLAGLKQQLQLANAWPDTAQDFKLELIEGDMNHANEPGDSEDLLTESQMVLYAQLSSLSLVGVRPGMDPPTQNLSEKIQDFAKLYSGQERLGAIQQEVVGLNQSLEQMTHDRDSLLKKFRAQEVEHTRLADAHRDANAELSFLRTEQRRIPGLEAEKQELEQALRESAEKADYLFHQLSLEYQRVLMYGRSLPGLANRLFIAGYKALRFKSGVNTALDDVVESALEYEQAYGFGDQQQSLSRLQLIAQVIVYVFRHPMSSLRSFSWHRLRRAISVFRGSDSDELNLWVRQRFPGAVTGKKNALLPVLDDSLDELELTFPVEEAPAVSIVMPVFNEYRMTVYCLQSLLQQTDGVSYEVIIADDASTDLVRSIEQRVSGVRVCRAESNRGFVLNCNAAAALARGEYIVFLNNDTALTKGWLKALVGTLETHSDAGIVGPKLLFGSGDLQEAGGVIWNDASGWNYGRMDDPGLPAYNYLKAVDYVSGACLMVRGELWREIGGFDERYVPAYYEDTDLCFAARQAGHQVLYQPASVIYHFEGVSNGTDTAGGIKQYQLTNQEKFREKWSDVLQLQHFPNGDCVFQARDRSRSRRTVLVIDHYVPSYDKDAGSRSTWQYLSLMVSMGYNVKFIGANFFAHQPYTHELEAMGIEVLVGESMARRLDHWLGANAAEIDAVYIHRPHVAEQFLPLLKTLQPRPKLIFFGHDLHYLRTERQFALSGDAAEQAEARRWRQREYALFDQVDQIYYPSQVEVEAILSERPDLPVRSIPLYALDQTRPHEYQSHRSGGMLFVGGFNHPPNLDAMLWFIDEVLPLVHLSHPDLSLHIVGSNMPEKLLRRASDSIVIHGFVSESELVQLYAEAKLAVVPLRYGAGVKGKVIEALQYGVPLVTTSIGAEGLPEPERVMWVADEPQAIADAIGDVVDDGAATQHLAQYSDYLEQYFSRARAEEVLREDFGEPWITHV